MRAQPRFQKAGHSPIQFRNQQKIGGGLKRLSNLCRVLFH
jgi:hypothetical protein